MECKCSSYNDFNCKSYSDRYPDLKNAYSYNCEKLHNHWITKGQLEGRIACKDIKDFDWQSYYFRYDDLKVLGLNFNNLFSHWKKIGKIEGRDASKLLKKKYSLIGNCQCIHLNTFLKTNSHFMSEYSYIDIKPIYLSNKNEIDLINDLVLPQLDLLIIQPVKDNFKNYYKYSSKYILTKINKNCKVIMFPSLYFKGYFPNVFNYDIEHINISVHDKNLIKIFKMTEDKKSFLKKCEDIINSDDFYNKIEVINNIKGSLFILRIKEEKAKLKYDSVHFIKVSDYIESHFQKALLFYSLNHCSKHIYRFLSDKILEYLKITKMSYDINLDPQKNAENMILYNSVKKQINPNIEDDILAQRGIITNNLREYLEFHYDKYSQIKSYMLNLDIPE